MYEDKEMPRPPDIPTLRARIWTAHKSLQPLLAEMLRIRTFLRGSAYELKTRCGKASCVCLRGQLHRRWVLSESVEGKKRLRVLPQTGMETWRRRADDYREFRSKRAQFVKITRRILEALDALERAQRRDFEE